MKRTELFTLVLMAVLAVTGTARATLLANDGGFEYWTSATDLTYWSENTYTGQTLVVQQDSTYKTEGNYSVYLESTGKYMAGTNIFGDSYGDPVDPNKTWQFSMDYRPAAAGKQFTVQLWQYAAGGGSPLKTYQLRGSCPSTTSDDVGKWLTFQFDFGAGTTAPLESNTAYVLTRISHGYGGRAWAGHLDNAQITLVPEPATIGVLVLGFGFWMRRRS